MPETQKIDAHVQWSGGAWQNFLTLQAGLPCEFKDHRTCKTLSDKLNGQAAAQLQAEKDKAVQAQKDEVAQLAVKQLEQGKQDLLALAARLRGEAQRDANLSRINGLEAAQQKAAAAIAAAKSSAESAIAAANAELEKTSAAIAQAFVDAQQKIDAADWKAAADAKLNPPPPAPPADPAPPPAPPADPAPAPQAPAAAAPQAQEGAQEGQQAS